MTKHQSSGNDLNNLEELLSNLEEADLVKARVLLDKEMEHRGISLNIGHLGEQLAIKFFQNSANLPNLMEAPTGAKNVDALSRDGERYSVKTQQSAKKTGTIYPDISDPNNQLFEYLLIVRLDRSYQLKSLHRFSWADFIAARSWDKRMNAWYISISNRKLSLGECLYNAEEKPDE